jgi:hypothetical protein
MKKTVSRESSRKIARSPDGPTAQLVNFVAGRILDISPFDNGNTEQFDHPRHIEDFAEEDGRLLSPNVGRHETADHGHALEFLGEIDQVCVCHNIVRPTG